MMQRSPKRRQRMRGNTCMFVSRSSGFRAADALRWLTALVIVVVGLTGRVSGESPKPGSYQRMDYGPVIAQTVRLGWPKGNTAYKALAVRLDHDSTMIFDIDTLRFAGGAVGGWIDISKTDLVAPKGVETPTVEGALRFASPLGPGWAEGRGFNDPRPRHQGHPIGNLPKDHAHYKGYYRHGDRVVIRYTVGSTEVLELPAAQRVNDHVVLTRTLRIGPGEEAMTAAVALDREPHRVRVVGVTMPEGVELREGGADRIELHVPPRREAVHVKIAYAPRALSAATVLADEAVTELVEPSPLTEGGPTRWDKTLNTSGTLGESDWAYAVDRLPLPTENPWGARMRPTGFDFLGEDAIALCTFSGDVWIVRGVDGDLDRLRWKRFASGMFFPMGLVAHEGKLYVTERGQITRLHDLNGDGEADLYENFNNDHHVHPRSHTLGLRRDERSGAFYFFKNGNRAPAGTPHHGVLIRVSADGSKREVFAWGFRGNNGLAIGPKGRILSGDQQGRWTPVTRIDFIERGKFYGFRPHSPPGREIPVGQYEPPVCWIPYGVDTSAASPEWVGDDRFGPLAGHWLLTSYGKGRLLLLLHEKVGGVEQGGVVELPLEFDAGIMRARSHPGDGQLYVAGMRGWGTVKQEAEGELARVRYTGRPARLPIELSVKRRSIRLTFTDRLDPASATNPENWTLKRWRYRYSKQYGSPELSLKNPDKNGRDSVSLGAIELGDDGRSVTLHVPDLKPVMQMMLGWDIRGADGSSIKNALYHTIHELPRP